MRFCNVTSPTEQPRTTNATDSLRGRKGKHKCWKQSPVIVIDKPKIDHAHKIEGP